MSRNLFTTHTPAPQHGMDAFDLSHEKKLSFKFGQLVPIYWDDVTPGDIFRVSSEVFIRFAPMLAPVLHRYDVFTHYFWVPYRLLMTRLDSTYADWEGFITGDPESQFTNQVLPYVEINNGNKSNFEKGDLPDYFGIPPIDSGTTVSQTVDINVLPFMAYQLTYDEYYRDQNLQSRQCGPGNNITMQGGDRSAEISSILSMRYRNYEKDYFTAALPTAYAGASSDVELDIDTFGIGGDDGYFLSFSEASDVAPDAGDAKFIGGNYSWKTAGGDSLYFRDGVQQSLVASLEIYELRRAQALVRSLEAEQRGGKRYVEMLLGKFGVISDDYRSAIPQYLGGGKQHVQVSEVTNMSQTLDPTAGVNDGVGGAVVAVDPQANLAGNALSVGKTNRFERRFTEHGIVLGIMSVLPRTAYQDGIERYWRKTDDRFEFFDPYLQGIGDQAIDQSEVYFDWTGSDKDDVFGYAPRWSEYKFKNSSIHGDFRDDFDYWHSGIKLTAAPSLNANFIQCAFNRDEVNRIFAVESSTVDKLYAQVFNSVRAIRQMRLHDIPK
jgi:hypothetical protein